jgi:hypothetical protein
MATSILTPLQLTASAALLNNQGLKALPTALAAAISQYNSFTIIAAITGAINNAAGTTWCSAATLISLETIRGTGTGCAALGDSIPAAYTTLTPVANPSGLTGLVSQTANYYLGYGDSGRFAQGFMAVQAFISTTNSYINTAVNAPTYLGPSFSSMDSLTTADIATVNSGLCSFGTDLAKQGQLTNLNNLELYGTPAGLLQQISAVAGISNATVPAIQNALTAVGLTNVDIQNLVSDNRVGLFNPDGITNNEFDQLQLQAYNAMTMVSGDDLAQILSILDVTTPDINSLSDLLDPKKIFPLSYLTLQTPSPTGPVPVFNANGSLNSAVQPIVNSYLPTASGCDELGKIIPPGDAVANKAIQVALQQIPNIAGTDLPALAEAVKGYVDRPWDPAQPYLANDLVANGDPIPDFYRAQQDVPVGIDINNTSYWLPTTLGGQSDMSGLPDITALTTPVPASVTTFFDTSIANGTGPNGTITVYDVLGTAIDYNGLATYLTTASTALTAIVGSASYNTLLDLYQRIENVCDSTYGNPAVSVTVPAGAGAGTYANAFPYYGGDLALQTLIPLANTALDGVVTAWAAQTTTMNTAWNSIASSLSSEKAFQTRAGIDYFNLVAGEQNSVMAFVQNLPSYAALTDSGQAAEFLEDIADTTIIGGQSMIGSMREARNQDSYQSAGLFSANHIPADPPITPSPAVIPVQPDC